MTDSMWTFSWWSSWTPAWLLRQQKRAIKQAGKKLQIIDRQYSTKMLKDDINAETLLTSLQGTKVITWTTVWWIILTPSKQVILVHDLTTGRWFPKGGMQQGESEQACLLRKIQDEIGLTKDNLKIIKRLWEYEWYSENHSTHKLYIWYLLELIDQEVKLTLRNPPISQAWKFDTEAILDILESEHQQKFWSENKVMIQAHNL